MDGDSSVAAEPALACARCGKVANLQYVLPFQLMIVAA